MKNYYLTDADKKQLLLGELFLRIARDFPGDVGCWSIYFMNYVILQEGESMFLGPNIPHAYIYGGKSRSEVDRYFFFFYY